MGNEDASSSLLPANGFVVVVRTSALHMLLTGASPDFAASISLVSLSLSLSLAYTCTGVCAHKHIHSNMLAGAPFVSVWLILPSFCLQIGGQRQRGRAEGEESCEAKRLIT